MALSTDVLAAEALGVLEAGPDNFGAGPVLLVYEVDVQQRVVTVLHYALLNP